jgi:hypothetical protein
VELARQPDPLGEPRGLGTAIRDALDQVRARIGQELELLRRRGAQG